MQPLNGISPARNAIAAAAALATLLGSSGCLRHRTAAADAYRLQDQGGLSMLIPAGPQSPAPLNIQTVSLTLPVPASSARRLPANCAIEGTVFSLRPASDSDNRSWTLSSPSATGWEKISGEKDLRAEWRLFVQALGQMNDRGCFPASVSSQTVRSAVAAAIPIPASVVPVFMYSDQGERFVDLAPGMEIGIQKVLSTSGPAAVGPNTPVNLLTADYEIVPRPGGKLGLKLTHRRGAKLNGKLLAADRDLLALDRRFSGMTALRLFLKGFTEEKSGKSESDALLVGTSNPTELETVTEQLRQQTHFNCAPLADAVCTDFPSGSVSLFSIISVNGRRTTFPFGSPLGLLLFSPPFSQPPSVLESVQVFRELSPHRYGRIQFPRTDEGARQVLLLPGDRIVWKNERPNDQRSPAPARP